jgi:CBS domain-containing protein
MQPRAEEFLRLLNEIDEHLKQRVKRHEGRGFMMRLEVAARSDPTLHRYREELREFSELRNAIVHYREFPAHVIAEPTEEVVARLRQIYAQVLNPPKLDPTFASSVRVFKAEDPLLSAARFMAEHDHSQVPVLVEGQLALLSTEGIGRWATLNPAANLAGVSAGAILPYERQGSYHVMSGEDTVENARLAFHHALGKGMRLRAVLVTRGGKPDGKLLGIVTAADLLEHQQQLL